MFIGDLHIIRSTLTRSHCHSSYVLIKLHGLKQPSSKNVEYLLADSPCLSTSKTALSATDAGSTVL